MILDNDKAEERLKSPHNLANRLAAFRRGEKRVLDTGVLTVNAGRQLPRMPEQAKEEIKNLALSGAMTQTAIAERYGITQPAVSALKKDALEQEAERRAIDEEKRDDKLATQIKDEAASKMLLAMGLITEEKLENLKARELSMVASNLAKVHDSFNPKAAQVGPTVNLVVYSPEVREEKSFKIVEIQSGVDSR